MRLQRYHSLELVTLKEEEWEKRREREKEGGREIGREEEWEEGQRCMRRNNLLHSNQLQSNNSNNKQMHMKPNLEV
jgi:hypothetical protein